MYFYNFADIQNDNQRKAAYVSFYFPNSAFSKSKWLYDALPVFSFTNKIFPDINFNGYYKNKF